MRDAADDFAEAMVARVGVPHRLRQMLRDGAQAAARHRYSVDIVTGYECSRIQHDVDILTGEAQGGRVYITANAGPMAVWDFLHELGHALTGLLSGQERTCVHEARMREVGWKWAQENGVSWTETDREGFIQRARDCLATYCETPPTLSI